jgi:hypothetical protein
MIKLKNILTTILLTIISQPLLALHSIELPDGKILRISLPYSSSKAILSKIFFLNNRGYLDEKFGGEFVIHNFIPLQGNPENFKIILLASGNIMVCDQEANEMVIFDKDGNLLHNVEGVKRMIAEKNNKK